MTDQYFTQPSLADKLISAVASRLPCKHTHIFLDPCAGRGALVDAAVRNGCIAEGIELDKELSDYYGWTQGDFLNMDLTDRVGRYCGIICNPPFANFRRGNYAVSGRKLPHKFLAKSASLLPRVIGFIMFETKAFPSPIKQLEHSLPLEYGLIDIVRVTEHSDRIFNTCDGEKIVPVHIFLFGILAAPRQSLALSYTTSTKHFSVVRGDDPDANLLLKRWGHPSTVLQNMLDDPDEIAGVISNLKKKCGRGNSIWLHLKCKNPRSVKARLRRNKEYIIEYFMDRVIGGTSVAISPTDFCDLYNMIIANEKKK